MINIIYTDDPTQWVALCETGTSTYKFLITEEAELKRIQDQISMILGHTKEEKPKIRYHLEQITIDKGMNLWLETKINEIEQKNHWQLISMTYKHCFLDQDIYNTVWKEIIEEEKVD